MAILKSNKFTFFATIILVLIVSSSHNTRAQSPPTREYQIKAGFIYNFLKFIEWPAGHRTIDDVPICILGNNPFGTAFDTITDKKISDKTLVPDYIKSYLDLDIKRYFIIFISSSEIDNLGQILEAISKSSILTISDTKGFANKGVMINFYLDKNKVRFEINPNAAKQAGLKISSKLLRLARNVTDAQNR